MGSNFTRRLFMDWGVMEKTEIPRFRNGSKGGGDSYMGSFDCETGILPLSYRAPHGNNNILFTPDLITNIDLTMLLIFHGVN